LSFSLALALVTLVITGTGPSLTSPVVMWTRPVTVSPYGPNISVGTTGVYVATSDQLSKYDFDGSVMWTTQVGDPSRDLVTGVSVAPGGVYVTGARVGDVSAGLLYEGKAFVGKYDFDGEVIWAQYFETGSVETALVSADSKAVYVAGTVSVFRGGHSFVAKFDSNGNELWTQQIESRRVTAVSVGPKGVYLAEASGCFYRCHGFWSTYVTAIDADGNTLWTRQLNDEVLYVEGHGYSTVSVGPTGVYVAETTPVCSDLLCLTGRSVLSFVRKYDFGGNEVWTRLSGSGIGISADSKGAYVAGDGFVQHIDSHGNEVWMFNIESQVFLSVSVSARGVFVLGASSIARLCASLSCVHK